MPGLVLVLDPLGDVPITEVDLGDQRITLVVGPEGGIAPREFEALVAAGAVRVRLGIRGAAHLDGGPRGSRRAERAARSLVRRRR